MHLPADVSVVDVETSGLGVHTTLLTQVAVVRVREGRLDSAWVVWLSDGDESLARAAEGLRQRLSGVVVGHNAAFDVRCVASSLERVGVRWRPGEVVCTMRVARRLLDMRRASLAAVAEALGVDFVLCHDALSDALATAEVYVRLRRCASGHRL